MRDSAFQYAVSQRAWRVGTTEVTGKVTGLSHSLCIESSGFILWIYSSVTEHTRKPSVGNFLGTPISIRVHLYGLWITAEQRHRGYHLLSATSDRLLFDFKLLGDQKTPAKHNFHIRTNSFHYAAGEQALSAISLLASLDFNLPFNLTYFSHSKAKENTWRTLDL